MVSPQRFVECCQENGVGFFTGVPDSLLKDLCAYLTDHVPSRAHVIAANEGGAIGLAAGHYLATAEPALVYMQNSGQGNTVNPIASLADPDVYSIPMVLLVGWRGEPGRPDEPQHVKQGKVTFGLYEALGIPTSLLPEEDDEALAVLGAAIRRAQEESRPVALVVRKGTFSSVTLQRKEADLAAFGREDAIGRILQAVGQDAAIVSTTGKISREVYETRIRLGQDHSHDFLTVGSMGHASQIALGIALSKPNRLVVCLDGDGAALMHLGALAITGQSGCGNLLHIVLNNAAHDSVGGQPTVAGAIDLPAIAAACGYEVLGSASDPRALADRLTRRGLHPSSLHPAFLEVRVRKGARADLGRPKETPVENRDGFMEWLKEKEGHSPVVPNPVPSRPSAQGRRPR